MNELFRRKGSYFKIIDVQLSTKRNYFHYQHLKQKIGQKKDIREKTIQTETVPIGVLEKNQYISGYKMQELNKRPNFINLHMNQNTECTGKMFKKTNTSA